jgi:alpha-beta hydrolase superfamily lysophospholipase
MPLTFMPVLSEARDAGRRRFAPVPRQAFLGGRPGARGEGRSVIRRGDFARLLGTSLAGGLLSACGRPAGEPSAPAASALPFAAAVRAIRADIARDAANAAILPAALPRLYESGKPARHAVVLYHGFTNCPQQFDQLAQAYHMLGCNVYVPRIPRHGLKDRLTHDLVNISVQELEQFALDTFERTRALGSTVSVVGLSLGGTLALWLAQTQPVDLAVPIAPFLMPIPNVQYIGHPAIRLLHTIPNMYFWWDIRLKEHCKPDYAYPGYPTHALAELVFLGDDVVARARRDKPRARNCIVVLNEPDNAVDNRVTRRLLASWKDHGAGYREFVLRWPDGAHHDVIDPTTFARGPKVVYPQLEALVLS